MGKTSKNRAPWQQRGQGQDRGQYHGRGSEQSSWELWRGSWKSTSPKAFPTFDRQWGPGSGITVLREERRPGAETEDNSARAAQTAVNTLRKAEHRVQKLLRDKEDKAARFAAYEKEIKASYAAEVKRYESLQERLSEVLVEAKKQLQAAKDVMAQAADCFRTAPMEVTDLGHAPPDNQWERLIQRPGVSEPPVQIDPELLDILRRYKRGECLEQELPTFGAAAGPPQSAAPAHPEGPHPAPERPPTSTPAPPGLPIPTPNYGAVSPTSAPHRATPYPVASPNGQHMAAEALRTGEVPPVGGTEESGRLTGQAKDSTKTHLEKVPSGSASLARNWRPNELLSKGPLWTPFVNAFEILNRLTVRSLQYHRTLQHMLGPTLWTTIRTSSKELPPRDSRGWMFDCRQ